MAGDFHLTGSYQGVTERVSEGAYTVFVKRLVSEKAAELKTSDAKNSQRKA